MIGNVQLNSKEQWDIEFAFNVSTDSHVWLFLGIDI